MNTIHVFGEIVAIAGVVSAVLLAWGTIIIRLGRRHIDQRCSDSIKEEVADIIGNGVTDRINRLEDKLDNLIGLHINWDGIERRGK